MKLLFNRVYDGADEMFAIAEKTLNETVTQLGTAAPVKFPDTAYFLANHYTYLGEKVTTLGELKACLQEVRTWLADDNARKRQRLDDVFRCGYATFMAAETIEACKYAKNLRPYADDYWGHMSDAEVRELGVPLVTGDIPGFVVIIGPAPSDEEAAELIKSYQSCGIFVFLIGGIIDQAKRLNINMSFSLRVVPAGPDIWAVTHIISLVNRAAMIFGAVQPGYREAFDHYTFNRINAFVNAFDPVADIVVACGGGAISMGFPVITNDVKDMWKVPKSLIIQPNSKNFIETSLEAKNIKIKASNINIPVAISSAYEGEIVRRSDVHIEIDSTKTDCFEWVRQKAVFEIGDHSIELTGKDFDEFEPGSSIALGIIVEVAGKNMQSDFEPVFERKIHHYLNYIEGVMHTGQRDLLRIRVSKNTFNAGLRARHFGEVIYNKIIDEFGAIIDKCQVKIITDTEKLKELRAEANKAYEARDERIQSLTDESVNVFYSCILCQSFSPAHVCVVSPERLGLCGAVSWLDAKATNELNPNGPCRIITKEHIIDEKLGIWEDVNKSVDEASHGSLKQVSMYSLIHDPMTSCGCFECICGIEPLSGGVVIVNREHTGMTPLGMTFSEMASMTGGGVQTPGFMGHGKQFISSKKFIKAEGGSARIVWMPAALKDLVRVKLNKSAKEMYNIDDFSSMIADETIAEEPDKLMEFLSEKGHPALGLESLL